MKEKRTGNVNFGASMGQGTGVGGFIGLDQPNLFGRCKRGSLQWQFGRYINDFNLTYSDPTIRQSRISGSVTAYHSAVALTTSPTSDAAMRTGGQLQVRLPGAGLALHAPLRVVRRRGREATATTGLLGEQSPSTATNCFRSTLGVTATHDTRVGLPFAAAGGMQTLDGAVQRRPARRHVRVPAVHGGDSRLRAARPDRRAGARVASR